ncbi:MAG: HNH endonuclease [Bacteroidales bacterium]|nr:HNH endonuclease [Bacteroidales bacterium]
MGTEQFFIDEQADFYQYLVDKNAFKKHQTYRDYITRLRYVSQFYRLDKSITKERVDYIIEDLKKTIPLRERYNSPSGVRDIGSGLRKFLEYAQSDYRKQLDDSIIQEEDAVLKNKNIDATEKESILKSRIGQGVFRQHLIDYWKGCSVTDCVTTPFLVASHIRPWRKSDNKQRLDVFNGLLLIPNLDKLFDRGYISFGDDGKIICSDFLSVKDKKILGVYDSMRLKHVGELHLPYLRYHRESCFL